MKWLSIFRNSEIESLKAMIGEYKELLRQEKERSKELELRNLELNNKVIKLLEDKIEEPQTEMKEQNNKLKLTKRENEILKLIEKYPNKNNIELAKLCNLTTNSFNVLKNKIKNKGYII